MFALPTCLMIGVRPSARRVEAPPGPRSSTSAELGGSLISRLLDYATALGVTAVAVLIQAGGR